MAGGFQFQVTYQGFALTSLGLAFIYNSDYLLSGLALSTRGFVYNFSDIWVNSEDCTALTWTEVSEL